MSETGQTDKNSVRANVLWVIPESAADTIGRTGDQGCFAVHLHRQAPGRSSAPLLVNLG